MKTLNQNLISLAAIALTLTACGTHKNSESSPTNPVNQGQAPTVQLPPATTPAVLPDIPAGPDVVGSQKILFNANRDCQVLFAQADSYTLSCRAKDPVVVNRYDPAYYAIHVACPDALKGALPRDLQLAVDQIVRRDQRWELDMSSFRAEVKALDACRVDLLQIAAAPSDTKINELSTSLNQDLEHGDLDSIRRTHDQVKQMLTDLKATRAVAPNQADFTSQELDDRISALTTLNNYWDEYRFNQGGALDALGTQLVNCSELIDLSSVQLAIDQLTQGKCVVTISPTSNFYNYDVARADLYLGGEFSINTYLCVQAKSSKKCTVSRRDPQLSSAEGRWKVVLVNNNDRSTIEIEQKVSIFDLNKLAGALGAPHFSEKYQKAGSSDVVDLQPETRGDVLIRRSHGATLASRTAVQAHYKIPEGVVLRFRPWVGFEIASTADQDNCWILNVISHDSVELKGEGDLRLEGDLQLDNTPRCLEANRAQVAGTVPSPDLTLTWSKFLMPYQLMLANAPQTKIKLMQVDADSLVLQPSAVVSDGQGNVTTIQLKNDGTHAWMPFPSVAVTLECRDPGSASVPTKTVSVGASTNAGALAETVALSDSLWVKAEDIGAAFKRARTDADSAFFSCATDYTIAGIVVLEHAMNPGVTGDWAAANFALQAPLQLSAGLFR